MESGTAKKCEELARVVLVERLVAWTRALALQTRTSPHGPGDVLLLRSILGKPAQCLSLVKGMRPEMHDQIVLHTRKKAPLSQCRDHFYKPRFSCRALEPAAMVLESSRASS